MSACECCEADVSPDETYFIAGDPNGTPFCSASCAQETAFAAGLGVVGIQGPITEAER